MARALAALIAIWIILALFIVLGYNRMLNGLSLERLANDGQWVRFYRQILEDKSLSPEAKLKKVDTLTKAQATAVAIDMEIIYDIYKKPLPSIYYELKEPAGTGTSS